MSRKAGITETTSYRWRSKYGGMEVADAKRPETLEDENRRLKQQLVGQQLRDENLHQRGHFIASFSAAVPRS